MPYDELGQLTGQFQKIGMGGGNTSSDVNQLTVQFGKFAITSPGSAASNMPPPLPRKPTQLPQVVGAPMSNAALGAKTPAPHPVAGGFPLTRTLSGPLHPANGGGYPLARTVSGALPHYSQANGTGNKVAAKAIPPSSPAQKGMTGTLLPWQQFTL